MSDNNKVRQLLRDAISLQEAIETIKTDMGCFDDTAMTKRLLQITKICTSLVCDIKFPSFTIPPQFSIIQDNLLVCSSYFLTTILKYKKGISNYYGDFNEKILLSEIKLMKGLFFKLTDAAHSSVDIDTWKCFVSLHNSVPEQSLVNNTQKYDFDSLSILGKVYWFAKFGDVTAVSWRQFATIFLSEFDNTLKQHNIEVMRMTFASISERIGEQTHFLPEEETASGVVTFAAYIEFNRGFDSVFEAFQAATDPATTLLAIGGANTAKQVASERYFNKPSNPFIVKSLLGLQIAAVACSEHHVAILTAPNGQVYTWGDGAYGRLGHGDINDSREPLLLKEFSGLHVVSISCGLVTTAAVTSTGQLYTWGAGYSGRLGHGDENNQLVPTKVEALVDYTVKEVACSICHTVVLTNRGEVFSFGSHFYTGHNAVKDVLLPKRVTGALLDVEVKSIAAGGYHTIALSAAGRVYTWGHNRVGQLGYAAEPGAPHIADEVERDGGVFSALPRVVNDIPLNIKQITAGWGHSALLTEDGQLYTCGRHSEGQLGLGEAKQFPLNEQNNHFCDTFQRVKGALLHKNITAVSCGFTHTLATCADGEIFAMGDNSNCQYELPQEEDKGQDAVMSAESTEPAYVHSSPYLLRYFKKESWQVRTIAAASHFTLFLIGKRAPHSLRSIVANVIKSTPELLEYLGDGSGGSGSSNSGSSAYNSSIPIPACVSRARSASLDVKMDVDTPSAAASKPVLLRSLSVKRKSAGEEVIVERTTEEVRMTVSDALHISNSSGNGSSGSDNSGDVASQQENDFKDAILTLLNV